LERESSALAYTLDQAIDGIRCEILRGSAAKLLTRRIAVNIAKLPELIRQTRGQ
jgi:hypothetical protein